MSVIEESRAILEELELIENAISDRILRNPEIYYSYLEKASELDYLDATEELASIPKSDIRANKLYIIKKSKRNRKQILLQQHEIAYFLSQYRKGIKKLKKYRFDSSEKSNDPDADFQAFDDQIKNILEKYSDSQDSLSSVSALRIKKQDYSMFSNSQSQSVDILSKKAQFLDINSKFLWEEHYGEYMYLDRLHQEWLNVIRDGSVTLFQFLYVLESFTTQKYLVSPPVDRNSKRYQAFLVKLLEYLKSFFENSNPFLSYTVLEQGINAHFPSYCDNPVVTNDNTSLCVMCCKHFRTAAVFSNHLTGVKHRKYTEARRQPFLIEYSLHKLLSSLQPELSHTKAFLERKLVFTAEERILEMADLKAKFDAPAYAPNEREDTDNITNQVPSTSVLNDYNSVTMPLGSDGFPIPYWLYKLQGLDIEYKCEICGNYSYNGRRNYERHFSEQRHIYGLNCLGINTSPIYKGISNIKEAQALAGNLNFNHLDLVSSSVANFSASVKKTQKQQIEMEDQDGNVMTLQIYEDLKKQGLL